MWVPEAAGRGTQGSVFRAPCGLPSSLVLRRALSGVLVPPVLGSGKGSHQPVALA